MDEKGYNEWHGLKSEFTDYEKDPYKCLAKKHKNYEAYALLLPVPNNDAIKKQVLKNERETFRNGSHLPIELLFYGVGGLEDKFYEDEKAGGGKIIKLKGDKIEFANNVKTLSKEYFENFKPIFAMIDRIIG